MSRFQAWVVTAAALCVLAFAALFVGVWVLNVRLAANERERRERERQAEERLAEPDARPAETPAEREIREAREATRRQMGTDFHTR